MTAVQPYFRVYAGILEKPMLGIQRQRHHERQPSKIAAHIRQPLMFKGVHHIGVPFLLKSYLRVFKVYSGRVMRTAATVYQPLRLCMGCKRKIV